MECMTYFRRQQVGSIYARGLMIFLSTYTSSRRIYTVRVFLVELPSVSICNRVGIFKVTHHENTLLKSDRY